MVEKDDSSPGYMKIDYLFDSGPFYSLKEFKYYKRLEHPGSRELFKANCTLSGTCLISLSFLYS